MNPKAVREKVSGQLRLQLLVWIAHCNPVSSWQAFSVGDVAASRFGDKGYIVSPTSVSTVKSPTEWAVVSAHFLHAPVRSDLGEWMRRIQKVFITCNCLQANGRGGLLRADEAREVKAKCIWRQAKSELVPDSRCVPDGLSRDAIN